jgi:hypothetical protein
LEPPPKRPISSIKSRTPYRKRITCSAACAIPHGLHI